MVTFHGYTHGMDRTLQATSTYYLEVEGLYGTAQHKEAMEHTKKVAYRSFGDNDFTIYGLALDDPRTVDEKLLRYRICLLDSKRSIDIDSLCDFGVMQIPSLHVLVIEVDHTRKAIAQMWENFPSILAEQGVTQKGYIAERFRRSKVAAGKSEFLIQLP